MPASVLRKRDLTKETKLSTFLKSRRAELGITQVEVARAIGIASPDFISLVEQGTRKIDLDRIPRLADVLQVNNSDLCKLALSEAYPALYKAVFSGAATTKVRPEDSPMKPELDVARKLFELDRNLRVPLVDMIDRMARIKPPTARMPKAQ